MTNSSHHSSPITPHAVPVIAIDGPSGSGKGTVGQILAQRLGWHFLDSGAMYRIVGHAAAESGVDLTDEPAVAQVAETMEVEFIPQAVGEPVRVILNGREVGVTLRTEEGGRRASVVAAHPKVRLALLEKQRAFRRPPGLVADGRDMGTTVFPDAILKIFLTASAQARAERRYKQLKEKGFDANLSRLLDEIRERDERDAARAASPLMPASDACILDSSPLSISEVVDNILALLQTRRDRCSTTGS
jgi:cytidylate kinase